MRTDPVNANLISEEDNQKYQKEALLQIQSAVRGYHEKTGWYITSLAIVPGSTEVRPTFAPVSLPAPLTREDIERHKNKKIN